MLSKAPFFLWVCLLVNKISSVSCDGTDWVSINYVVFQASDSTTAAALDSIVRSADQLNAKGPWSITNDQSVVPPSNSVHDYLSWAPYHWPDCRWCTDKPKSQAISLNETGFDERDRNIAEAAHRGPHHGARQRMFKVHSRYRTKRQEVASESRPTAARPTAMAAPESTLLTAPVPTSVASHASNTNHLSASKSASQGAVSQPTKLACAPSPTTSMPPSATYTSCPYVGRDGKVNPDVRNLSGPGAINSMAQYVLSGSIAFAAKRNAKYSQDVVNAIDVFFLNPATKMNPNVNFGQVVRGIGPEGKRGTFTGVLDVRGIVKVINGILILKNGGSVEWTNPKDQGMRNWLLDYSRWLQESDIGTMASTRPNNHVTFYVAQLAAAKLYSGDKQGAINVLQHFFSNEFRDQIAASGEQPFEGIRTRPLHYRSFNLEALIMNAKLGDFLGVDFWSAQSKYGATIQTALDYAITGDPKGEDTEDLFPHVAAVAAAYGDPKGKYKAFLAKHADNYETRPFWFYDQPAALAKAPTSSKAGMRGRDGGGSIPTVKFACPQAFQDTPTVEIDNGIFVTCEEMRPLYGVV